MAGMALQFLALASELGGAHRFVPAVLVGVFRGGAGSDLSRTAVEAPSITRRINQLRQLP